MANPTRPAEGHADAFRAALEAAEARVQALEAKE